VIYSDECKVEFGNGDDPAKNGLHHAWIQVVVFV
jgi:hypothetical protein